VAVSQRGDSDLTDITQMGSDTYVRTRGGILGGDDGEPQGLGWHRERGILHPSQLQMQPWAWRRLTKHPQNDTLLSYLPPGNHRVARSSQAHAAKGQILG